MTREVAEETGVSVSAVRYHSSQPWPFPSSLMLGFRARAAPGSPVHVGGELEDARWFTREQLRSGEALAPPTQSISWRLIESWLKGAVSRVCLLVLAWQAIRATAWWWPPTATNSTSDRRRRSRRGQPPRDPRRARPARRGHLARPGSCAPLRRGHQLPRAAATAAPRALARRADSALPRGGTARRQFLARLAPRGRRAIPASTCCSPIRARSGTDRNRAASLRAPAAAGRIRPVERAARHAVAEAERRRARFEAWLRGPAAAARGAVRAARRPHPGGERDPRTTGGLPPEWQRSCRRPSCFIPSTARAARPWCCCSRAARCTSPSGASMPRASRAARLNSR